MSSKKEVVVEGFSLDKVKKEPRDEEGAGGEAVLDPFQAFTQAHSSGSSGAQSSTPQNGASGMGLVAIKQELPDSPEAGQSFISIGVLDPVTLQTLHAIKKEIPEGSATSGGPRAGAAPPERERIGNSDYFRDPVLGLVKEGDPFNLDLNMSLEDAKALNFQFDDLASLLNSTPGFEENYLFDLMRKDPLAAFNLPNVTVEKVLQLIETDVVSGRLEHIKSNWRRVVIGTYRFGKSSTDPNFPTDYILSRYGFSFSVRHTNIFSRHQVKVCIPITDIMDFKIYNGLNICVMGIQTGSACAAWIRSALGMEHDPKVAELRKAKGLPSYFYCPLLGGEEHKWIILMVERLSEADYSRVKPFFLHSNGMDFVCDYDVMNNTEAKKFVVTSKVYE